MLAACLNRQAIVFYCCTYCLTKLPVPQQRVPLDEIPFHYCLLHMSRYRSTTARSILWIQFYNSLFSLTSSSVPQAVYSSRRVPIVNFIVSFPYNCELGDQFVFHGDARANSCPTALPRCFKYFRIEIPCCSTNSRLSFPTSESSSGSLLDYQFLCQRNSTHVFVH